MEVIAGAQMLRFIAAFILVISMMGGLALIMKRINARMPSANGRRKRLQVMEILPLDGRRKAVILRRDDREHLVILGANGETLVESGIESQQDVTNVETLKDAA